MRHIQFTRISLKPDVGHELVIQLFHLIEFQLSVDVDAWLLPVAQLVTKGSHNGIVKWLPERAEYIRDHHARETRIVLFCPRSEERPPALLRLSVGVIPLLLCGRGEYYLR